MRFCAWTGLCFLDGEDFDEAFQICSGQAEPRVLNVVIGLSYAQALYNWLLTTAAPAGHAVLPLPDIHVFLAGRAGKQTPVEKSRSLIKVTLKRRPCQIATIAPGEFKISSTAVMCTLSITSHFVFLSEMYHV